MEGGLGGFGGERLNDNVSMEQVRRSWEWGLSLEMLCEVG